MAPGIIKLNYLGGHIKVSLILSPYYKKTKFKYFCIIDFAVSQNNVFGTGSDAHAIVNTIININI